MHSIPIYKIIRTFMVVGILVQLIILFSCSRESGFHVTESEVSDIFQLEPFTNLRFKHVLKDGETLPDKKSIPDIRIWFELDKTLSSYHGKQVLYLFNDTINSLSTAGFLLYPDTANGSLIINSVRVNGRDAVYHVNDAILTVELGNHAKQNREFSISIEFSGHIPEELSRSAALMSDGETFFLGGFYPDLFPFREDGTWEAILPSRYGDPPENPLSTYLVRFRAPANLNVLSSGILHEGVADGDTRTYTVVSGPVRDFLIAGSSAWKKVSMTKHGVTIHSYYPEGNVVQGVNGAYHAADAISIFERRFGPYPFSEFDVVYADIKCIRLGMEYPGVAVVNIGAYQPDGRFWGFPTELMLEFITVEETAHQWFYNLIGNQTFLEPWIDESLTQFAIWYFYNEKFGQRRGDWVYSFFENRWRRAGRQEIPLNTRTDLLEDSQFYTIIQGRAALFIFDLEMKFGKEKFDAFLDEYVTRFRWERVTSRDFERLVYQHFGDRGLDHFREWVYGEKAVSKMDKNL